MDSQSSRMTIWLVAPSGLSLDPKLAADLVGCVAALAAGALGAGEKSGRGGSFADQRLVSVVCEVSDEGIPASPGSLRDAIRLLQSSK